ncbi:MAG: potassium-transporting ATPase subunit F [Candidatus Limnocylindrales bacterium]
MNVVDLIVALLTIGVGIYLLLTLLRPEDF